jgi:Tetratricopeptide repeat
VVPPPVAEESAPAGGASAGMGEAGSGMTSDTVPPPVPAAETPAESQPEVPVPPTGPQSDTASEETSMAPEATTEMEPQSGTQTPLAGEEPYPAEAIHEGTEPTTGRSVPGSAPVTAAEMQPGAGTAGSSSGKTPAEAKPYELLAAAREAFWMHNYDDAEKNYRALTELEPKNPDGYGELGNMYFSQGRWDEAAAAYYEAGTRLITEGRLEAARELVNVIRGLNGKQADELEKLVTSAATAGDN